MMNYDELSTDELNAKRYELIEQRDKISAELHVIVDVLRVRQADEAAKDLPEAVRAAVLRLGSVEPGSKVGGFGV